MTESRAQPAMTPQQRRFATGGAPLELYKELQVGEDSSWGYLCLYELIMALGGLPGALGMAIRMGFYPLLLGGVAGPPVVGRGVILRNPKKVSCGRRVIFDDYSCVEARGVGAAVEFGDHVVIGRFTTVAAKSGKIVLGSGVNVGSYCRIATQSQVTIGESTLVAAYVYIGPGNHKPASDDTPLIEREMDIRGGVNIGSHVWIGAHSTILDGVSIGDGAIVGAHSLVRDDVPARSVVAGVPAKVIREG